MAALDQSTHTLTFKVCIAWWLKPYFHVLARISALTGMEPNWKRVNFWINKAVTIKLAK